MNEIFYLVSIFVIRRAFADDLMYTTTEESTFVANVTIDPNEYTDLNDTNDFDHTIEFNYTGETTIGHLSTLTTTSTRSDLSSRITVDTPRTTLFHRYKFESVDYNDLPEDLKNYHTDCYGQHIRCVRHRTDLNQVCGFNTETRYYDDYYSPCEIELQNCLYRVKKGFGIYGTNHTNDVIYYNGEGLDCVYYLRRTKNIEEMHRLYFGGDDNDDED